MRCIGSFFVFLFCFAFGLPALLAAQAPYGYFTSHTDGQTVSDPHITITWVGCHNTSQITYQTRVNNSLVPTTQSSAEPCPDYIFAKNYSASATLVNGANTLYLKICDLVDCGETTITVNYLAAAVSVTPDNAIAPALPHRMSSSYNFKVKNTGGLGAMAKFTKSCNEFLSCSVAPDSINIPAGDSTTVTLSYTGVSVGNGQATVTATYSQYPTVTDNGVVNVDVTENPIWGVTVTPRSPTQPLTAGTSTFVFDIANTSQYTTTSSEFAISVARGGSVSSCQPPSVASVPLAPGEPPSPVSVVCTIGGSGSSGSVTMTALTNSPTTFSGSGTNNVTVSPTYNVSLTAINSKTEPAGTTSDSIAFTITNNSQNSDSIQFSLTRQCFDVVECAGLDPINDVWVRRSDSRTLNVPYNIKLQGTTGQLSVKMTSVAPEQTKVVQIGTTPVYSVAATAAAPSVTLPGGSSGDSADFTVQNTSTNSGPITFDLKAICTPVASCSSDQTTATLAEGASSSKTVAYTVSGSGNGTVGVVASSASVTVLPDTGVMNVTVGAAPSYSVHVTPATAFVTLPAQTTSDSATFTIQNTSTNTTGPINFTLTTNCVLPVVCTQSPAPVSLGQGESVTKKFPYDVSAVGDSGSISLTASSTSPNVPAHSGRTTVRTTPWYAIAVIPPTGNSIVTAGSTNTYDVIIQNQSRNTTTDIKVSLASPTCTGTVVSCSVPGDTVSIAQGAQTSPITLTYTAGSANPSPVVIHLNASGMVTGGTVQSSNATLSVTVSDTQSVSIDVQMRNPGTTIDRRSCLTAFASQNAAYECGDLRVVHELPATTTMDRERAPALIFNSRHARPIALLAADVTYSGPAPTILRATVQISDQADISKDFAWNSACLARACRIVVPVTMGRPTGLYPAALKVKAMNGSTDIDSITVSDTVIVVNRSDNQYGAGWWIDGLETLASMGPTKMLWIGGDGSTRVYTQTPDPDVYTVSPAYDRPDTLRKSGIGPNQVWRRSLGDSAYVEFNDVRQHVRTVNSMGWITKFFYNGTSPAALLDSIVLPVPGPSSAVRSYRFWYTSGLLDSVQAPAASGPRMTRLGRNGLKINSITDPDGIATMFGYDAVNRIAWRRNKLADTTYFDYDNGGALKQSRLSMARTDGAGSAITTGFRAAETRSTYDAADLPTPLANAYTKLDGPRTDVGDTTIVFVNVWGAPDTLSNALGQKTRLSRSNSSFPALVTKVVAPGGFETRAFFNSRALIDSTVAVNPYGTGSNAKTTFVWNPVWNRADSVIDPTGKRTRTFYRTTRPIVDSVRTGTNVARRVRFSYTGDNQLSSVTEAGGVPDSVMYDSYGNAIKTWTPLGRSSSPQYFTELFKDAIGRDTLVKYPISGDTTGSTKILYDVADRVIRTISVGPARPYTLTLSGYTPDAATINALTKTDSSGYDAEGNLVYKTSVGTPWMDEVNVTENLAYDAAGRLRKRLIGTGPDSMVYDPAGNLISARHRSGMWVTQSFDALNRVVMRVVPEVMYSREQCSNFQPGGTLIGSGADCHVVFPFYPNSGTSLRIPADTARFVYDAVTGHMAGANNRYARVRRSYYPGGALKTDSTALGFYDTPSIDETLRGQQYAYDLAGRRVSMDWYFGTINYQYNDFGALELITDPANTTQARITYDLKGQVDSLLLGTGVKEKRGYDDDGRLISKNRISTSAGVGTLVSDVLTYDKMNRVVSVSEQVPQQGTEQTRISYDGLGAVLANETSNGLGARVEEFRNDAFGNVVRRRTQGTVGLINDAPFAMQYSPVGELISAVAQANNPAGQNERNDRLSRQFVTGGQLVREDQLVTNPNADNTTDLQVAGRHYYGADDRLVAVQRYSYHSPTVSDGTWEEYWYDALGRRVLTRARREPNATPPVNSGSAYTLCMGSNQCRSFKERVWWDGDNALVEERTPEGGTSDVSNSGVIGNIHGLTIDEPLAVMADDIRIINYNWRGQGMSSVFLGGGAADLSLGNTATEVDWPAATQAETYFAKSPDATPSNNAKRWLGTFVANGQGTTGMLYRRNRYFDPKSGQFTQADPLGIAAEMNAFGFAAGDPINFSDPFGLCIDACVLEGGAAIGTGVYIGGIAIVAATAAIVKGADLGNALSAGADAARGTIGSITAWARNRQQKSHIEGKLETIQEHFGKLAGTGGPDSGDPNDPRNRNKWKSDIRRAITQIQEHIEKMTGARNKAPWQQKVKEIEKLLDRMP